MEDNKIQKLVEVLNKKNFKATYFEDAQAAKCAVLNEIAPGAAVGIGGSMTVFDMGLHKDLQEKGHEVFWHWLVDPAQRSEVRAKAANADVYLSSSNAVTMNGELVNIDGIGNRVSAMFFGPKKVIIICGVNKIADDYDTAIQRIKTYACPPNAKRLNLNTPCAKTDKCTDCSSSDRMCNVTVKMERPPSGKEVHVFLVGESLGF
jgi:L-lactate utilization protein LutB